MCPAAERFASQIIECLPLTGWLRSDRGRGDILVDAAGASLLGHPVGGIVKELDLMLPPQVNAAIASRSQAEFEVQREIPGLSLGEDTAGAGAVFCTVDPRAVFDMPAPFLR
jgi:hypothetical protein